MFWEHKVSKIVTIWKKKESNPQNFFLFGAINTNTNKVHINAT